MKIEVFYNIAYVLLMVVWRRYDEGMTSYERRHSGSYEYVDETDGSTTKVRRRYDEV